MFNIVSQQKNQYLIIHLYIVRVEISIEVGVAWFISKYYTVIISLKICHERLQCLIFLHEFLEIKWKQILSYN